MLYRKDFQPEYKHHINRGLSMHPFNDLLNNVYNIVLDFDVYLPKYQTNLQRGLVWTQTQKEQFILSLLKGISMSKLVAVQHKSGPSDKNMTLRIIDGKQRITTIFSYIKNEFCVRHNDENVYFKDLHVYCQRDIIDPRDCRWDIHYSYENDPISDDTLIQLFEQVNFLGTPQDVNHLINIKNKVKDGKSSTHY